MANSQKIVDSALKRAEEKSDSSKTPLDHQSNQANKKFSEFYNLDKTQFELDFVNIFIDHDTKVFIDPWAIRQGSDELSIDCFNYIDSYFQILLEKISSGDEFNALDLLSHTHEVKEIRLGDSVGSFDGKGMDRPQSEKIYTAIKKSKAIKTGLLQDIEDCALMIQDINRDKISDMIANIIRLPLIKYTQEQCNLHGVKMHEINVGFSWDIKKCNWVPCKEFLPIPTGEITSTPVILVPKNFVRTDFILNHTDFFRNELLNFEQARFTHGGVSLAKSLNVKLDKDGHVTKKELKKVIPGKKDTVNKFLESNPQYLDHYKRRKADDYRPIKNEVILKKQKDGTDVDVVANNLIKKLVAIKPGRDDADKYHNLIIGALTFVFSPSLENPKKEYPLTTDAIKRIDISFFNKASSGFFFDVTKMGITAYRVFFECKNISNNPKNQEVDQLAGRLGKRTSTLGFLVCRDVEDRALLLKRCKLALANDDKYMICLDDSDVKNLITFKKIGILTKIDELLHSKIEELTKM